MLDFVAALNQEIAELEQELQADPRHLRLEKLRELRRLYSQPKSISVGLSAVLIGEPPKGRPKSEAREKILAAAAEIIRGRTIPTSTADILAEIKAHDLAVHGKEPRNTLSAMLSNADQFKSHGRSGWTLVEPDQPAKNVETADGDTPASDPSAASSRARSDQPGNPAPVWGQPNGGG
jgi:hypothetical protein